MIQQTITPKNNIVNLSFEIPKNLIGKSLKFNIEYEKEDDNPFDKQMTQEQFVQMIEDAEKSPSMTLEEFNKRWEKKRQQILKLIP
jgi:hypothetical protein